MAFKKIDNQAYNEYENNTGENTMTDYDDTDFGSPLSSDDASTAFELIPAGKYPAVVTDISTRDTRDGYKMLVVTLDLSEEYAGRKVFDNLNLGHPKEETRKYARQSVFQLLTAAGVDSEGFALKVSALRQALIGQEVVIRVVIQPDKTGQYEPKNRIKGYYAYGDKPAQQEASKRTAPTPKATDMPPPQVAPKQNGTGGKRPWEK